jgi:hypothetical protein
MWKMRLVGCLILLLAIGMTAGAENTENTPGASAIMNKPSPAPTVVQTSGPEMTVKSPGAEPAAVAPDTGTDRKAVAPGAETAVSVPPGGRPIAIFDEYAYTFPAVMEGEEVKHDFVVRNKGDAPLIIDKVSAG